MKKFFAIIFMSALSIGCSVYGMDKYDPQAFDNAQPQKSFWLQNQDHPSLQFYQLPSDVANSIPKIRELIELGKDSFCCGGNGHELAIFGTYATNRLHVKNGIDDRGVRNQEAIAKNHQKFLCNLSKEKLTALTIMACHLYEEKFPNDLYDPWNKIVKKHRSEGRCSLEDLFKGQEEVGKHILDTCYEVGGHNDDLNTSMLKKSGLFDTQKQDQQELILSTSPKKNEKPESMSKLFTQLKSFFVQYKKYIFGVFGFGMGVALFHIMRSQQKISFYR